MVLIELDLKASAHSFWNSGLISTGSIYCAFWNFGKHGGFVCYVLPKPSFLKMLSPSIVLQLVLIIKCYFLCNTTYIRILKLSEREKSKYIFELIDENIHYVKQPFTLHET